MRTGPVRKAKKRRKPAVKGTSAQRTGSGTDLKFLFVRTWWVLRGAAAGVIVLGIIYGVYAGSARVAALPALAVKTIKVEGCQVLDAKNVIGIAGVRIGQPLLKVDLDKVRKRVVRHPMIKDATVVRELPDTLRITVRERRPAAAVMGRDFAVVDGEGVVLAHPAAYTDEFPVITGIADVPDNGKVAVQALPALAAIRQIASAGFLTLGGISEVNTSGERLLVSLTGTGTLLILPRGDVRGALLKLSRIVEAGLFDTGAPGYDLRFKGRVVVMPERADSRGG